jgi:hypothetical protein
LASLDAGNFLMNFVSPTPQSAIITITPEIAQKLLDSSPGNRRIRGWYVEMLASAMKCGEWLVTSQGIGIDTQGRLRDAHHRLTACVKTGTPFTSVVAWGLSDNAYKVTDRGLIRSYDDILNCNKAVAETLRYAANLLVSSSRPTANQIQPLIDSGVQDAIEALLKFAPSKIKYYSSATFRLGAILRILAGADTDYVYSQYRALVIRDYDSMTNASKALTRRVDSGQLVAISKSDQLARSLVVFDKSRQNISKIQIDDSQRFAATDYARFVLRKHVENYEKAN